MPLLIDGKMNRSLLAFSILLIVAGASSGYYVVSIFGFFLLFPAILSTPRPRPSRVPTGTAQQPRRVAPRPVPTDESRAAAPTAQVAQPTPTPPSGRPTPTYSLALFPNTMFPSFSQPLPSSQQPKEGPQQATPQRDELLEVGAVLTLLKLALG